MEVIVTQRKKPFKFSNVLASTPKFQSTVSDYWLLTDPLLVSISALFRLGKPLLRILEKEVLCDLSRRTKVAYEDLCVKQTSTLQNPTQFNIEEEYRAYEKWTKLADLEEGYLRQKAKLHWLNVGDRNNA